MSQTVRSAFENCRTFFGFNADSFRNQLDDVDHSLRVRMCRCGEELEDFEKEQIAVETMACDLLRNYLRWSDSVRLRETASEFEFISKPNKSEEHFQDQARALAVFKLMWGEAANLRFCPEALALFVEHRSYVSVFWSVYRIIEYHFVAFLVLFLAATQLQDPLGFLGSLLMAQSASTTTNAGRGTADFLQATGEEYEDSSLTSAIARLLKKKKKPPAVNIDTGASNDTDTTPVEPLHVDPLPDPLPNPESPPLVTEPNDTAPFVPPTVTVPPENNNLPFTIPAAVLSPRRSDQWLMSIWDIYIFGLCSLVFLRGFKELTGIPRRLLETPVQATTFMWMVVVIRIALCFVALPFVCKPLRDPLKAWMRQNSVIGPWTDFLWFWLPHVYAAGCIIDFLWYTVFNALRGTRFYQTLRRFIPQLVWSEDFVGNPILLRNERACSSAVFWTGLLACKWVIAIWLIFIPMDLSLIRIRNMTSHIDFLGTRFELHYGFVVIFVFLNLLFFFLLTHTLFILFLTLYSFFNATKKTGTCKLSPQQSLTQFAFLPFYYFQASGGKLTQRKLTTEEAAAARRAGGAGAVQRLQREIAAAGRHRAILPLSEATGA
eukprot:Cvel_30765.t1-p1 / transcript=Cvel_30765.t1 / gene=Cvel_30765 / organism=Chromera_velia_CCMP2878 / gene_product=hypothetical protein / transcript_product=hypothetical protein / location=Cvel_scaffold4445:4518-9116(+) / protein_length=603 / sequence_SO=supercontig / SO=protein_coding / is_pseudo=false